MSINDYFSRCIYSTIVMINKQQSFTYTIHSYMQRWNHVMDVNIYIHIDMHRNLHVVYLSTCLAFSRCRHTHAHPQTKGYQHTLSYTRNYTTILYMHKIEGWTGQATSIHATLCRCCCKLKLCMHAYILHPWIICMHEKSYSQLILLLLHDYMYIYAYRYALQLA